MDGFPLGNSTGERSTREWGDEILAGEELRRFDDDPAVVAFVNKVATGISPNMPLAYRYAAAIAGEERRLRISEFTNWKRRLLIDGGFVERPSVHLLALPTDVNPATPPLWSAIELLVQCRTLGGTRPSEPLPLARRLLVRWAAASEWHVRSGMEELERLGYIVRAGSFTKPGGSWVTVLWRVHLA